MARLELGFEGCSVPADIDGQPELLAVLATFGVTAVAADSRDTPSLILEAKAGRFHLSGSAYLSPFSVQGLDAAAGSVMAGLAACKALSVAPHELCIHGAAAIIDGRGYLFIAPFGTGKSSLMAELAMRGASVLADDVVLVNARDRTMTGLRLPPRLRQGFVGTACTARKAWIAERRILEGRRYTYLAPGTLAGGTHALTDIVLLNRIDGDAATEPVMEQATPGQLIPRLLWHNMSRHHAPSAIAGMASDLAEELRGGVLHAADFAAAAGHLASGAMRTSAAGGHPPLSSIRGEGLEVIRTDRGAIISDDQTGRIFEINESAFVMLTLLQNAEDLAEVIALLGEIYPDVPEGELRRQLAFCARQFVDCGLVDFAQAEGA